MGWPSGSTTRPRKASPTGTDRTCPVRWNFLAFFDAGEVTEDDDADLADVEVLGQAQRAVFEAKQLVRHDRGKALNTGDAVTCGCYTADLYALCVSGFVGRRELVPLPLPPPP